MCRLKILLIGVVEPNIRLFPCHLASGLRWHFWNGTTLTYSTTACRLSGLIGSGTASCPSPRSQRYLRRAIFLSGGYLKLSLKSSQLGVRAALYGQFGHYVAFQGSTEGVASLLTGPRPRAFRHFRHHHGTCHRAVVLPFLACANPLMANSTRRARGRPAMAVSHLRVADHSACEFTNLPTPNTAAQPGACIFPTLRPGKARGCDPCSPRFLADL